MIRFIKSKFSAFKHKNFRYFAIAQLLSQSGKWSHEIARAYLVIQFLGKGYALGLISLITAIPCLFLILPAGTLVDRFNVRRLMILTKSILAITSLSLFLIIHTSELQLWHLIIIGFIEGIVFSLDAPAFSAITVRLVPREDFKQALVLNTVNFHFGRMLGPFIAGLILTSYSPKFVFLYDSLTYLVLLFFLFKVNFLDIARDVHASAKGYLGPIKQLLKYVHKTKSLKFKIAQLYITIFTVLPLSIVIYKVFIKQKFNLAGDDFSFYFSISALGAAMGSVLITFFTPKNPTQLLRFTVPIVFLSILSLPLCKSYVTFQFSDEFWCLFYVNHLYIFNCSSTP